MKKICTLLLVLVLSFSVLTGADVRIGTYEWDDGLDRGSFTIDGKTQLICLDSEGYYLYFQDPDDRSAFHIIYDSRTLGDEITD